MIKALVFDFDGIILDTETITYKSNAEVFEQYGAHLPIEIWGQLAGTITEDFDVVELLTEKIHKPVDRKTYFEKQQKLLQQYIEEEDILPGVKAILETADKFGMKIGLATSSQGGWAKSHLERLGLLDYFDCIVQADDVSKVKPDPELYLKAVEVLGVEPNEAVAFEDSLHGARAAKSAGLYCVVIPNDVTRHLEFGEADRQLKTLAETSLEELIELFK